ncbi:MAG: ABC transporter permease subunit [Lachnospiraceae bacterium]|nr:ABC transporter permease subunit [Lachnospiraceae bacterium]
MKREVTKRVKITAKGSKNRKETRELTLMSLPAIIWYGLFCYLPLFGIFFAFKHFTPRPGESLFKNLFINSPWAGLSNFSFLLRSSDMPGIIFNTLFYNIIFLAAGIVIPVFLAIFLVELHGKHLSGLVQMVTVLPYFLSYVIVGYCVYGFLATDEGQINHLLKMFGSNAIQWYQSPGYWRFILIITEIWKSTGYSMVIFLCAITAIDRTLYESAMLDGARFMERVRHITIPLLRPTISTIFILRIGSILSSDFGLFYQVPLDSNSLQSVTQTLDVYVYKALMQQANFSYSAAASFLQSVVGCILLVGANLIIKRIDEDSSLG